MPSKPEAKTNRTLAASGLRLAAGKGLADSTSRCYRISLDCCGGRVTYEMMESYWPAVARGDEAAPPGMREWAVKLEAQAEVRGVIDAKRLPVDQQPPHFW